MTKLSPILLFVYNRPQHTKQTIQALSNCYLADQSELFIFSDGYKENVKGDKEKVAEVRKVVSDIEGFKNVTVIKSETNKGLAKSIINATNYAFNLYDRVITVEDDVIVGKYFLEYMNNNLTLYKGENRVYMISGYAFNLPFQKYRKSNYFLPTGTSQAWGTWKEKWININFEPKDYINLKKNKWLRFKFNYFGSSDYSSMLIAQMENSMVSSWAIRHRWHLFKNNGFSLFPAQNLIENIGWDGSGSNCGEIKVYKDNSKSMNSRCNLSPRTIKGKLIYLLLSVFFAYKIRVSEYLKNKLSK